jgi:hypothetical protein
MAPQNKWLTRQLKGGTAKDETARKLIPKLKAKEQTFREENRSLSPDERVLFTSWVDLLKETAEQIKGLSSSWRSTRLRARTLLCNIFGIGPEVFLLCTLALGISTLAGPNHAERKDCVPAIKEWWTTVTAPERLTKLASELCQTHSIGAAVAEYLGSPDGEGK